MNASKKEPAPEVSGEAGTDEAVEVADGKTTEATKERATTDPWDRLADVRGWPALLGGHLPERLFGGKGGLDDIRIEEYVDDGNLVVRGELPGIDPEKDLDIAIDRGRLSIRAERSSSKVDERDGYRSEFHYGRFTRLVDLPSAADVDHVDASYTDGILEIRIPLDAETDAGVTKVAVTRR